ncbi:MAG: toll/interleukin-1 receptor domain-containing protein [Ignavibacteria bacterium]|nr:toll/interleukin-1 receptor domain-containing protein [Ignavibacteria bacterium]
MEDSLPLIFISHVTEDAEIAKTIGDWIKQKYANSITTFISSENLSGGDDWWRTIRKNLKKADLILVILTKRALNRPWIYFESGGGYFLETRTIPLVLDINIKDDFKPPLSQFQYYNLGFPISLKRLIEDINEEFKPRNAIEDGVEISKKLVTLNSDIENQIKRRLQNEKEEEQRRKQMLFENKCFDELVNTFFPFKQSIIKVPSKNCTITRMESRTHFYYVVISNTLFRPTLLSYADDLIKYSQEDSYALSKPIKLIIAVEHNDDNPRGDGRTLASVKSRRVIILRYSIKQNKLFNTRSLIT